MEFEYTISTPGIRIRTFDRNDALNASKKYDVKPIVMLRGGTHDVLRRSRSAREYEKRMKEKAQRTHTFIVNEILTGKEIIWK